MVEKTEYRDKPDQLAPFPIFEHELPPCAKPIVTLINVNNKWISEDKQRIFVSVDLFRRKFDEKRNASLSLTLNGQEVASTRQDVVGQGQFLLIRSPITLENEIQPFDVIGFKLQSSDEKLLFLATIYQYPESCLVPYVSFFPVHDPFDYKNGSYVVIHLREMSGEQIQEVISYVSVPELDNSMGTSALPVQIELERYYRNQIIEHLTSNQLSSQRVQERIVELYELSPNDPEGTKHTALCPISVVIPAGAKAVVTVEWTEQWAEGLINEGKEGDGNQLGTYKVFLGYAQPCNLSSLKYYP